MLYKNNHINNRMPLIISCEKINYHVKGDKFSNHVDRARKYFDIEFLSNELY